MLCACSRCTCRPTCHPSWWWMHSPTIVVASCRRELACVSCGWHLTWLLPP